MAFINITGNGELYTTEGDSNGSRKMLKHYGKATDAAFMAACNDGAVAWNDRTSAYEFYYYDFTGWGFATTSVTVPVGADRQMMVFERPAYINHRAR